MLAKENCPETDCSKAYDHLDSISAVSDKNQSSLLVIHIIDIFSQGAVSL